MMIPLLINSIGKNVSEWTMQFRDAGSMRCRLKATMEGDPVHQENYGTYKIYVNVLSVI